jgi:acetoin utilization deacetylase AcuC-like enzyme
MNNINVPIVPLWKDASEPASVKTHNTRHKACNSQELSQKDDSSETSNYDVVSDNGSGSNNMTSPRSASTLSGCLAYREASWNRLLPALRAFNPDLILISAGFDAAKGDVLFRFCAQTIC